MIANCLFQASLLYKSHAQSIFEESQKRKIASRSKVGFKKAYLGKNFAPFCVMSVLFLRLSAI